MNEIDASTWIFPVAPLAFSKGCLNLPMLRINPVAGGSRTAALMVLSLIQFIPTVLQAEYDPGVLHIYRYLIYTV